MDRDEGRNGTELGGWVELPTSLDLLYCFDGKRFSSIVWPNPGRGVSHEAGQARSFKERERIAIRFVYPSIDNTRDIDTPCYLVLPNFSCHFPFAVAAGAFAFSVSATNSIVS